MSAELAQALELANMVRVGKIVSIDGESNTAVVSLNEVTATPISSETADTVRITSRAVQRTVHVLSRGSRTVKDYFNYEVGEMVICVFPSQVTGSRVKTMPEGYICGSWFDLQESARRPPAYYDKIYMVEFGSGNYISVDLEDKTLDIRFDGEIYLNGKGIYLNG